MPRPVPSASPPIYYSLLGFPTARRNAAVVHVDWERLCLWTAASIHPPDEIWVWRATVEWYWQEEAEELGETRVPVPLHQQIPRGLTRAQTQAYADACYWWTSGEVRRITVTEINVDRLLKEELRHMYHQWLFLLRKFSSDVIRNGCKFLDVFLRLLI
jgi:hypothetical protein